MELDFKLWLTMKKPLSVFGKKIGSFNLKNACMIDPHELRIGNWVKVGTIESIVDYLHLGSIGLQGNAIINNFQQVDPIPLTPEILEKCGFENGGYDMIFWSIGDFEISGVYDSKEQQYYFGVAYYDGKISVEIKSLHQLQNLYFALTRTELNYSPDNKINP